MRVYWCFLALSGFRRTNGVLARVQVRTQTLVKSAIIQVDATPFKQYYAQHYGVEAGLKKKTGAAAAVEDEKKAGEEAKKLSNHVERKLKQRNQNRKLDEVLVRRHHCILVQHILLLLVPVPR